jgi:uncharacterized membrane protein YcaP (DUF421 family)
VELHLHRNFVVTGSTIEVVLWGVALYLLLFTLFRFIPRREAIPVGIAELLALVLIADASLNAMAGESTSIAESTLLASGMLACALVVRTVRLHRRRGRCQPD